MYNLLHYEYPLKHILNLLYTCTFAYAIHTTESVSCHFCLQIQHRTFKVPMNCLPILLCGKSSILFSQKQISVCVQGHKTCFLELDYKLSEGEDSTLALGQNLFSASSPIQTEKIMSNDQIKITFVETLLKKL